MVDVAAAAAAIGRGEVVAFPTETFYGLAVDALNQAALARLRVLKGREAEKAFSLLVSGRAMLASLCSEISPLAERLMAQHWPGPLTLALPARPGLPASIVADGCVAVRVSPHSLAQALVVAAGCEVRGEAALRSLLGRDLRPRCSLPLLKKLAAEYEQEVAAEITNAERPKI